MLTGYIAKVTIAAMTIILVLGAIFSNLLENTAPIYFVNFSATLIYFVIIIVASQGSEFDERKLLTIVFIFNLLFVAVYNYLFFSYNGNFFAFAAADSLHYHYTAKYMNRFGFFESFHTFPWRTSFDDKGFPVLVSMIYRIIDSPLAVNFFNMVLNLFSTFSLYKIGLLFLSKKGAFIAALIFGISTYSVFYQASGLKETVMIFLILASFRFFYNFFDKGNIKYFFLGSLFCFLISFFRLPLVLFVLSSIATFGVLKRYKGGKDVLYSILVLCIAIALFIVLNEYFGRYSSSFSAAILRKQQIVGNRSLFLILTAFASGLLGPFPTVIPSYGNENISVLAGSLILKVFLSSYFIIGCSLAFRNRTLYVLPLAAFSLSEIVALSYLLDTFEFRKGFPHIPFVILIAIFAYEYLHSRNHEYRFLKGLIIFSEVMLFGAIFSWNYLRIS